MEICEYCGNEVEEKDMVENQEICMQCHDDALDKEWLDNNEKHSVLNTQNMTVYTGMVDIKKEN